MSGSLGTPQDSHSLSSRTPEMPKMRSELSMERVAAAHILLWRCPMARQDRVAVVAGDVPLSDDPGQGRHGGRGPFPGPGLGRAQGAYQLGDQDPTPEIVANREKEWSVLRIPHLCIIFFLICGAVHSRYNVLFSNFVRQE